MKLITQKDLEKVLHFHRLWICGGRLGRPANLGGVSLYGHNLIGVDFYGADLRDTNFNGANISGSSFYGAIIEGAKGLPPLACPEKGSFIGFKQAQCEYFERGELLYHRCIVELEITENALRSSAAGRKCRCSEARVISITDMDGSPLECEAYSLWDKSFKYRVGEIVKVVDFDTDRWHECAPGIHFFITRQEAVDY